MKANTMVAPPTAATSAHHFGSFAALHGISKTASSGRISKPSSTSTTASTAVSAIAAAAAASSSPSEAEEMHACFSLLKSLVPTVRPSENISKTELLQHVIDYISELSATLAEANHQDEEDDDELFGDENTVSISCFYMELYVLSCEHMKV